MDSEGASTYPKGSDREPMQPGTLANAQVRVDSALDTHCKKRLCPQWQLSFQ